MDNLWGGIIAALVLVSLWQWTTRVEKRLRSIERDVSALLRHFKIDPSAAMAPPSDEVKRLATDRARRIDAIRLYRQETGADLKAAQATIDCLAEGADDR